MRTYNQACGLAKAMDVAGDRWAMLIVRELLIRERCRFTDLKNGLPGIASNLLAERLRELEAAGLIARHDAPPPIATSLLFLTDKGRELEPILLALGQWGASLMDDSDRRKLFQSHWMVLPLRLALRDNDPDRPPTCIAIESDGEQIEIRANHGRVDVALGRAPDAAAILTGPGQAILGLLLGKIPAAAACVAGVAIDGDAAAIARVIPQRAVGGDASHV